MVLSYTETKSRELLLLVAGWLSFLDIVYFDNGLGSHTQAHSHFWTMPLRIPSSFDSIRTERRFSPSDRVSNDNDKIILSLRPTSGSIAPFCAVTPACCVCKA